MRLLKVSFREEALSDLQNIFDAVFKVSQNSLVARRFVHRIEDRCDRIGSVPYGGRSRDDLEDGLRTVPFEHSAVIAYKVEPNRVLVTNIFYGGRNYEALYLGVSIEDEAAETAD